MVMTTDESATDSGHKRALPGLGTVLIAMLSLRKTIIEHFFEAQLNLMTAITKEARSWQAITDW